MKRRLQAGSLTATIAACLAALASSGATAQDQDGAKSSELPPTPARGYLEAHRDVEDPLPLIGGPVRVSITQNDGQVFVALPDNRELDPVVFGSPDMPLAYGGFPIVQGVPPQMREVQNGTYTQIKQKSPFGDAHTTMPGASLQLTATDATLTDAAQSEDSVQMTASWKDKEGNTYTVICCKKLQTAGVEHPTFGGVVTNHILHGLSRVGTPLFPTVMTQVAFWGAGEVKKNGEVVDGPRPVHGMLTEYARTGAYELAFDDEVSPSARHFHVMVAPVMPAEGTGELQPSPVKTGFTLPNGEPLPFWHVMFENVETQASRQSHGTGE